MGNLPLDPDLDRKMRLEAAAKGESVSESLRRAAPDRVEKMLGGYLGVRFADLGPWRWRSKSSDECGLY